MALKRYILKTDYAAPYMRVTGDPRKPGKLCAVRYKRGDVVIGELKHANDKPAFVLVIKEGVQLPFPLTHVSEVTEKAVDESDIPATSSADGKPDDKSKAVSGLISNNPKVQYMDSAILGGLLGLGAVWLAEKRGWIQPQPDKKNKLIGIAIGVAAGLYIMYRVKNGKKKLNKE